MSAKGNFQLTMNKERIAWLEGQLERANAASNVMYTQLNEANQSLREGEAKRGQLEMQLADLRSK
jgi:hypothetical protein